MRQRKLAQIAEIVFFLENGMMWRWYSG